MSKQTKSRNYLVEDAVLRLATVVDTGVNTAIPRVASETTLETVRALIATTNSTLLSGVSVVSTDLYNQVGYSQTISYYTGVVAGNPSGNKNVSTIVYADGVTPVLTKTFTYDALDDVLTIINT